VPKLLDEGLVDTAQIGLDIHAMAAEQLHGFFIGYLE